MEGYRQIDKVLKDVRSLGLCKENRHNQSKIWSSSNQKKIPHALRFEELFHSNYFQKYLDMILITDEIAHKSMSIQLLLENRQNVDIVLDFVFAKHNEIECVFSITRKNDSFRLVFISRL